jgi:hypothetical protein
VIPKPAILAEVGCQQVVSPFGVCAALEILINDPTLKEELFSRSEEPKMGFESLRRMDRK